LVILLQLEIYSSKLISSDEWSLHHLAPIFRKRLEENEEREPSEEVRVLLTDIQTLVAPKMEEGLEDVTIALKVFLNNKNINIKYV